ncbi:ATP-binding cassette domain-containing protein [Kribbella sp. NPDC051587]|uniref:ATP-binding cassette domain-containing protein n=1 Tax=Kribbella sp. NPDC051587 TaxID=3364119 RepID=UPI0037BE0013
MDYQTTNGAQHAISVRQLSRTFKAPIRQPGIGAAVRSVFRREYRTVHAVDALDFQVDHGEVIGLIGPNGAGKTTTMKLLAGVLYPSAGHISVAGYLPQKREYPFLKQIALLRGSQPIGGPPELTVADNLQYRSRLYGLDSADYKKHAIELIEILDLNVIIDRQIRALSLGERMRAGLAISLLHKPSVLFLDEPTIGLDATVAMAFRRFIGTYATLARATVVLTSHHMAEVEALCPRIVLIDNGRIRFDGAFHGLVSKLTPWKQLTLHLSDAITPGAMDKLSAYQATVNERTVQLRVPRREIAAVTARILGEVRISDLTISDPPLELVLDRYYRGATGDE